MLFLRFTVFFWKNVTKPELLHRSCDIETKQKLGVYLWENLKQSNKPAICCSS